MTFLRELPFDYILGRNPGMVCSRHPKSLETLHASPSNDNVLDGRIECMADVEGSGDIGRRNDQAK